MNERERRRMRLLEVHALVTTPVILVLALAAFAGRGATSRARFAEIDAERINIVEKDGTLRLTISNRARVPDPVIGGKSYPLRGGIGTGAAGLIYFNDEGNEAGGLMYAGKVDSGGGHHASGLLTFDQFNQNEAIALSYSESNGRRSAGLSFLDQPATSIQPFAESLMVIRAMPEGAAKEARMRELRERGARAGMNRQRVFVGKRPDRSATLVLSDTAGRPRARLIVDSLGAGRLEFLDESGRVTLRLPDGGR